MEFDRFWGSGRPAGSGSGGLPAAGSRPRPGPPTLASETVLCGSWLQLHAWQSGGHDVRFRCDLPFEQNQHTEIKNQAKLINDEGAIIIHQELY